MNNKTLNINAINSKREELGFSQADLADKLGLSREIISQWFKGNKFPRPKNLLELARLLDLKFEQILVNDIHTEPIICFRKKGNVKVQEKDFYRAKEMGELLRYLVKYLPFPKLSKPSSFREPKVDYFYIQEAATEIRNQMDLKDDVVDFSDLICFFSDLHAVIIPVLWGPKNRHENALRIYLPDSMTTWVYLNLDTNIIDFKFWMSHELGHVKSPDLLDNEGEDFAEKFAEALLFPEKIAKRYYHDLVNVSNKGIIVNKIKIVSEKYLISPVTILNQINAYANSINKPRIKVNIFAASTNLTKSYPLISKLLFETDKPSVEAYINKSVSAFGTPFFESLKNFIINENKKSGYIQRVLNLPILDAAEIYRFLIDGSK